MSTIAVPNSMNSAMAADNASADKDIPLTNMQPAAIPNAAEVANTNPENSNRDLEAGPVEPEPALVRYSSDKPPEYKEQDMAEPLPPYMTRVRGVMRGEEPFGAAMPVMERRTGFWVVGAFVLLVVIFVGVGVGIRIANTNPAPTP